MADERDRPRDRIELGYEVEVYGARRTVTLPFVVTVLADLHAESEGGQWLHPLADRKALRFDLSNLDARMDHMRPAVELPGVDGEHVTLEFRSLDDFGPQAIAQRHPATRDVLPRRTLLAELHGRLLAHADLAAPVVAFLRAPPATQAVPPPWLAEDADDERTAARFGLLLDEARRGLPGLADDPVAALNARILELDAEIGRHVTHVLRSAAFRRLEGSWLGLAYLLKTIDANEARPVRVLSLHRSELAQSLLDPDGPLATVLIHDEFETYGGTPSGLWVVDEAFAQRPADVQMLGALARWAARADALVMAAGAPVLLDAESFAETQPARAWRLQRLNEYAAWRVLRQDPTARHVMLIVPRVAARERHALAGLNFGEFRYVEPPADAASAPWMNGAFVLAATVGVTQVRDGWPASLDTTASPVAFPALPTWTGVDGSGRLRVGSPVDGEFDPAGAAALSRIGLAVIGRAPGTTGARLLTAPLLSAGEGVEGDAPRHDMAVQLALDQVVRFLRRSMSDRMGRWRDLAHYAEGLRLQVAELSTPPDDAPADDLPSRRPQVLDAAELLDVRVETRHPTKRTQGSVRVKIALRLSRGFARAGLMPPAVREFVAGVEWPSERGWDLPAH